MTSLVHVNFIVKFSEKKYSRFKIELNYKKGANKSFKEKKNLDWTLGKAEKKKLK